MVTQHVDSTKTPEWEHHAAVLFQKHVRRIQAKKVAQKRLSSAVKLQHWYIKQKTVILFRKCHNALKMLQRTWRRYAQRNRERLEKERQVQEALRRLVRARFAVGAASGQ